MEGKGLVEPATCLACAKVSSTRPKHAKAATHVVHVHGLVEKKGHELGDFSLARLKLGGLYAARISSTKLIQLQLARFSSIQLHSTRLAQFKLNNLEVAESVLCQLEAVLHPRRVSYGMCKAHGSNMCTAHGSCGMCAPCKHMLQIPANFKATVEALLKHSSSFHFENMLTPILDPLRSKEARFTCFPVSFGIRAWVEFL
ncbi:hypothetical protein GQ457_01G020030 [Hibiscus cannabinus]